MSELEDIGRYHQLRDLIDAALRLAAASNDLERRIILDKEIKRLRWMIKRELPRALRRMQTTHTTKASHAD